MVDPPPAALPVAIGQAALILDCARRRRILTHVAVSASLLSLMGRDSAAGCIRLFGAPQA
jgi:hypothetical protein